MIDCARPVLATWVAWVVLASCGESSRHWEVLEGIPRGRVDNLWSAADGTVVVPVDTVGVFYWVDSEETWEQMRFADGRAADWIYEEGPAVLDNEGRLIFYLKGTQFYRVNQHPDDLGSWIAEPIGDPLEDLDAVYRIAVAADGTLVAMGRGSMRVARLGPQASQWQVEPTLLTSAPDALGRAGDGELYLALPSDMLYHVVLGDEVSLEPAYDCNTAAFAFCTDPFMGTTADSNGDLYDGANHELRRMRVDDWSVEDVAHVDQTIRGIFATDSGVYFESSWNMENKQVHRYRGGSQSLIVDGIGYDIPVFVARNGDIYQIWSPPAYINTAIIRLE